MLAELSAVTAVDANVMYATQAPAGSGQQEHPSGDPQRASGTSSRSALGFQANALDAYDANHLVVVGDAGKVYYTANATAARLHGSRAPLPAPPTTSTACR